MNTTSAFTCPYCENEFQLPEDVWYFTCPHCGQRLNITAQFAYLRGLEAFSEGQDILDQISPRKRRLVDNPKVKLAMELFMEAYSSLQLALQSELAEAERSLGVEMMASMAQEFSKQEKVSPLEGNYWVSLMVEQTAQKEYDQLKEKLARKGSSPWEFLVRLRWRARQKQLRNALVKVDQKIAAIERQIEFVERPRARNTHWKP